MTTIVPRNSPPLMRVLDELVDDQLLASGSAVATNAIRNVYDVTPNNTPATVLPWLAWGLNSFAWADGNDDAANRAAVAEGLNSNAYKGSASQVIQGVRDILAGYLDANSDARVAFIENVIAEQYDSTATHGGVDNLSFTYNGNENYGGSPENWYHFAIEVLYPKGGESPEAIYDHAIVAFLDKSAPLRCRYNIAYQENANA